MDNGIKQRLIGACVLISVGVIFLPTLLYKDEPQIVDSQTQVPVAPKFELKEIQSPVKPTEVQPLVEPDELFQVISDASLEEQKESFTKREETPTVKPSSFDDRGLPKAWVVQVASFSEIARAKAFSLDLRDKGYKAFYRKYKSDSKILYRVYVGPNINRNASEKLKSELDLQFSVDSLVLRFNP